MNMLVGKTSRTDLICIACGGFRTELAISDWVGIHKKCVDDVHVRRGPAKRDGSQ